MAIDRVVIEEDKNYGKLVGHDKTGKRQSDKKDEGKEKGNSGLIDGILRRFGRRHQG